MADPVRPVLLVVGSSTGGTGRHVASLARHLAASGRPVRVAAPAAAAGLFGWPSEGIGWVPLELGRQPADLVRVRRSLRAAAAGRPVVHAHGARAGAAAAVAGLHPLIVTWHNAPAGSRRRRLGLAALEWLCARGADLTVVASPDLAERARRRGARDVRFLPVPAPPAAPRRTRAAVRAELGVDGRFVLLAVGRLAAQKRYDLLLRAIAGWGHQDDRPLLLVAGDGALETRLRRQGERWRCPVRWLGHRDDVTELLAAADLFVSTSDWEARPLAVQEAMRSGLPVLATAVGGVPDLVQDGAMLVPPGSPAAVRAAIERLAADPAERERLAGRAREVAATWPTAEASLDAVVAAYLDLE